MKPALGYASQPTDSDPRSTESWALAEASRRLILAASAEDGGKSLRDALILNQRLWSIFQGSLIDPACPLPKEIRDNVLALSVIADRRIMKRLGDLDGSKIQSIIDLNRAIAEGLAVRPADGANAAAANSPTSARPAARPDTAPAVGQQARPVMDVTA
jgi:flagellar biosynthesis activator protein FlaF